MSENQSKNEGSLHGRTIAIKCAKSKMPPVLVLAAMLDRLDELWAVYLMPEGGAEIWAVDAAKVRAHGYFTHGPNVQKRVEIHRCHVVRLGTLISHLSTKLTRRRKPGVERGTSETQGCRRSGAAPC